MRTATEDEVSGHLKEFLADLRGEALVITREGEPAAILVPVPPGRDQQAAVLAANPRLRELIEMPRAQFEAWLGLSEEEFWRQVDAEAADEP